eukprot:s5215_g2.t1
MGTILVHPTETWDPTKGPLTRLGFGSLDRPYSISTACINARGRAPQRAPGDVANLAGEHPFLRAERGVSMSHSFLLSRVRAGSTRDVRIQEGYFLERRRVSLSLSLSPDGLLRIGLGFDAAPPTPVFVDRVAASSWAQEKGFLGGEQILAINGLLVSKMDINDFKSFGILRRKFFKKRPGRRNFQTHKKQMKGRPIELLIDWTAEDPSKLVATLEADASVVNLGLGFEGALPGPLRVRSVDSRSWAEDEGSASPAGPSSSE